MSNRRRYPLKHLALLSSPYIIWNGDFLPYFFCAITYNENYVKHTFVRCYEFKNTLIKLLFRSKPVSNTNSEDLTKEELDEPEIVPTIRPGLPARKPPLDPHLKHVVKAM